MISQRRSHSARMTISRGLSIEFPHNSLHLLGRCLRARGLITDVDLVINEMDCLLAAGNENAGYCHSLVLEEVNAYID